MEIKENQLILREEIKSKWADSFEVRQLKSEKFECSEDIHESIRNYFTNQREEFYVYYLDNENKIICLELLAIGSSNFVHISIKTLMKKALEKNAVNIVLCHNHPSRNLNPSSADIEITTQILQACELLQIKLLDHIIFSEENYYSMYDKETPPFS